MGPHVRRSRRRAGPRRAEPREHAGPCSAVTAGAAQPPADSLPVSATQYTYDLDRALKTETHPDTASISYGYDTSGRLTTTTIPVGVITRDYYPAVPPAGGAAGARKSIVGPYGQSLAFTYDGSLLKSTTWSGSVAGSGAPRCVSVAPRVIDNVDDGRSSGVPAMERNPSFDSSRDS